MWSGDSSEGMLGSIDRLARWKEPDYKSYRQAALEQAYVMRPFVVSRMLGQIYDSVLGSD